MTKEERKEYKKEWVKNNPDKMKKYRKKYYETHKEQFNEYQKRWNEKNKEKVKEMHHNYYLNNKEKFYEKHKEWSKKNKKRKVELVSQCRRRRVDRLRAEGCTNAWSVVIKGAKPKYNEEVERKRKIEKLERELEYLNDVIKGLRPNDGDTSFYYWQKSEVEKELEELKKLVVTSERIRI